MHNHRVTRPILQYFGGKWRLAPWIISHFPEHRIYLEPYGGAASVLLRKPRVWMEVYNDLDDEVVNLFRVLRDPAQAADLERMIALTPYARKEYDQSYEPATDPVERAGRYLFRSVGGMMHTGARGKTGFRARMPKGVGVIPAMTWARWPGRIGPVVDRLRGVIIESRPALDVIRYYDEPDTLIYADPPYVIASRSSGSFVYGLELSKADHGELAEVLNSCRGMVAISGYRDPLYADLYEAVGWHRVERETRSQNGRRIECLWLSPNLQGALEGQGRLL